jgi:hypothetical protein
MKPALDLHMLLSLKIAFNLKELTLQNNVKKFFFTRFKRMLIKKSIIDNILNKVEKYILQTLIITRSKENKVYEIFMKLIWSNTFRYFSMLCIIGNTVVLALDHDQPSPELSLIIEQLNLAFFAFFCFELIAKLLGQGFKYFMKDKFNWFDGIVVIVSAIDVILIYTFAFKPGKSSIINVILDG